MMDEIMCDVPGLAAAIWEEREREEFEAWAASIGLKLNGRYAETLAVLCAEEAFKAGYRAALSKENSND